ncbi:MAG: polysaccharide deacetylase family protein [Firmicutes bacterium HGW-Firmicutes-15]|nr:MAG: polysaccharide deacetylase family protein [Firmicutes bacterium HGW-Firmicutes-15]
MGWGYMILFGLILAAAIYTVIPDFFLHYLGAGTWKRQYTPGVAITFDDGPDPDITPQILDILDRYQVKATFFVVGEKAATYPDLIKLIRVRGHYLGAHSQHHRFAWFMSPWETWKDWDECIATLENLTGEVVEWVRPPWGTFNLSTWFWLRIRRKHAVLWNAEGHDWQFRRNPEQIISRILNHTKEGSIVLLHDAGGEKGAPVNTLNALDLLCVKIIEDKKLPLVALEFPQWSVWRKLVVNIWTKWEQLYAILYKVERISSTNVFRLSRNRYKGPNLYSQTGQLLAQNGDLVGEIHLDSIRLQDKETDIGNKGIHILRQVRRSLPVLASYVASNPEYEGIKVFVGLTLINQGVKRLGFQVQEMPTTLFIRSVGVLQKLIILLYRSPKKARMKKYTQEHPKLVWISKHQLLENWLSNECEPLISSK